MKSRKTLIGSVIIIIICLAIIAGVAYALLADSIDTRAHLRAGALDVILIRTNLEYKVLDENGRLTVYEDMNDFDFTEDVSDNVFGISESVRIAPNSYFDATFTVGHGEESNVAFDYKVGIDLNGTSNDLAEQVKVIVTGPNNVTVTKMLSDFNDGATVAVGTIDAHAPSQNFNVRVEFIDDEATGQLLDSNKVIDNDLTQSQTVAFDLYVKANQPE